MRDRPGEDTPDTRPSPDDRTGAFRRVREIEQELARLEAASSEAARALALERERRLYRRMLLRPRVKLT